MEIVINRYIQHQQVFCVSVDEKLFHTQQPMSMQSLSINMAQMKSVTINLTGKDKETKRWDVSDPTSSTRCSGWQKNTLSPSSMCAAHDFLACVDWQKGHGCVPVPHEGSGSAISGAEYKWGAVWCALSSPRYLLLWNAAVTSLNIWLPTD